MTQFLFRQVAATAREAAINSLPSRVLPPPLEELLTLLELRRRLGLRTGRKPHQNTIYKAILDGMPTEWDPLVPSRRLFPWQRILAWLEKRKVEMATASGGRKRRPFGAPGRPRR